MNKIFVLICISFLNYFSFAQPIVSLFLYDNMKVVVFEDSIGSKSLAVVQDDPIKEIWASVEIVSKSSNRFQVCIKDSPNTNHIDGWLEKGTCAVTLWPRLKESSLPISQWTYSFFSRPTDSLPYQILRTNEIASTEVPVLDISGKWLKVQCKKKSGEKIVGWIINYCGNPYGCEGN